MAPSDALVKKGNPAVEGDLASSTSRSRTPEARQCSNSTSAIATSGATPNRTATGLSAGGSPLPCKPVPTTTASFASGPKARTPIPGRGGTSGDAARAARFPAPAVRGLEFPNPSRRLESSGLDFQARERVAFCARQFVGDGLDSAREGSRPAEARWQARRPPVSEDGATSAAGDAGNAPATPRRKRRA